MTNKIKTPWGGGLNSLKPQKFGFTLAEVLITLAIIGIVAALTIPTLVAKNEKKQLYTQFMKTYNTLSNALSLTVAENGNPEGWVTTTSDSADENFISKYLYPNLKIVKTCDSSNYSDCNVPIASYKSLGGNVMFPSGVQGVYFAVLADSSFFGVIPHVDYGKFIDFELYVDINGAKGPNIMGRDFHVLSFSQNNGSYYFGPDNDYETNYNGALTNSYGISYNNCDPLSNASDNGFGCAARLLSEGAMNY